MRSLRQLDDPQTPEEATGAIYSELATLHADMREGLDHVVERLDAIGTTLQDIAGTLKAINARDSWRQGDPPPSGPH